MAKIAFPKEKAEYPQKVSSGTDVSRLAFGITKFVSGILLLPFVYSVSLSFLNQFGLIGKNLQQYFWAGIISFIIIYLFVWEPAKIYLKGQRLLEIIFKFFAPLVKFAPFVVPIYFILIASCFLLLSLIVKTPQFFEFSMLLVGMSFTLHIIFSAKSIRAKQPGLLQANYIFGFSFIYIFNVMLLGFVLNLAFQEFSFVVFFNRSFQIGAGIFYAVFKQLFL